MLEKILNSKIIWTILFGVLIILIILLFIPINDKEEIAPPKEDKVVYEEEVSDIDDTFEEKIVEDKITDEDIIFKLNGESNINIYKNNIYQESGFVAVDKNNYDLSNCVSISGSVNNKIVGVYEITYTLNYLDIKKVLKRTVNVLEVPVDKIQFNLKGDEIVYLNKNEKYVEPGYSLLVNGVDMTNSVVVSGKVDTSKVLEYTITYTYQKNNTKKVLTRKVIVFDLDSFFQVDLMNTTIKVVVNNAISHVRLPNVVVSNNQVISYNITNVGSYEFHVFTKNLKEYVKVINITDEMVKGTPLEDKAPSGSCKAILKAGKTSVTVQTSDTDIKTYNYNGVVKTTNTYVADKYLRSLSVILTDLKGQSTKINCSVTMESLPVIPPASGESVKYKAESDTLKVYVTTKSGWYLTRIWTKDANYQLRKQFVVGNSFQRPKTILESAIGTNYKDKIVLGFNASAPIKVGSYYSSLAENVPIYNLKEPSPLLIANGQVIINDYLTAPLSTEIYYIDGSNQLKYAPSLWFREEAERKQIYQDVIDSGAQNTMMFGPILVLDGVVQQVEVSGDYQAKRQALCQIDTNNFILITTNTATARMQNFANFVGTLGCKMAVNFDGGGSIATLFKPAGTNTITTVSGNDRSLSSVMYFTELS